MDEMYSVIEISGQVDGMSTAADLESSQHFYINLLYKDPRSPLKKINVYCWDQLKDYVAELNLAIGDRIKVTGELSAMKRTFGDKTVFVHTVRAKSVELVGKQEQPQDSRNVLDF